MARPKKGLNQKELLALFKGNFVGPPTFSQACALYGYVPDTKKCSACGEVKDRRLGFYNKETGKRRAEGKFKPSSLCKQCNDKSSGARRRNNPVRYKAKKDYNKMWNKTPKGRETANRLRRKQYATDPEYRSRKQAYNLEYRKRAEVKARASFKAAGLEEVTPEMVLANTQYRETHILIKEIYSVLKRLSK